MLRRTVTTLRQPAKTYAEPALNSKPIDSGAWLRCFACGWNGARDYAAAINIALLGVTFLKQDHEAGRDAHPTMTQKSLNSVSYLVCRLLLEKKNAEALSGFQESVCP